MVIVPTILGAILLFGFLTCTLWWTITAFNMFLEARRKFILSFSQLLIILFPFRFTLEII